MHVWRLSSDRVRCLSGVSRSRAHSIFDRIESMTLGKKSVCIVGGGCIGQWAAPIIASSKIRIGVDRGTLKIIMFGASPDVAVGDFDSVSEKELIRIKKQIPDVRMFPKDKDKTDMQLAVEVALSLSPSQITIVGATGARFDHTLANLHLLEMCAAENVPACIMDQQNRIRVVKTSCIFEKGAYAYISFLSLSSMSRVSLDGFLYPLFESILRRGSTLGVSNEIVKKSATLTVHSGVVGVVESKD